MKFMTAEKVDAALRKDGMQKVLAEFGRLRIAPGFTVADYVKIGEFYRTAGRKRTTTSQTARPQMHQAA